MGPSQPVASSWKTAPRLQAFNYHQSSKPITVLPSHWSHNSRQSAPDYSPLYPSPEEEDGEEGDEHRDGGGEAEEDGTSGAAAAMPGLSGFQTARDVLKQKQSNGEELKSKQAKAANPFARAMQKVQSSYQLTV